MRPAAPTFFTLGKAFTRRRRQVPWLQTLPFAVVRYTLQHQADAWQACFKGIRGYPQCHARRRVDRFTLPDNVKIEATTRGKQFRLYIPKIGWVIVRGALPYPGAEPVSASVKRDAGKWYCVVTYAVSRVGERIDDDKVMGVDRNVRQCADSDGTFYRLQVDANKTAR